MSDDWARVRLAWSVQHKVVVMPKTLRVARLTSSCAKASWMRGAQFCCPGVKDLEWVCSWYFFSSGMHPSVGESYGRGSNGKRNVLV